MLLRIRCGKAAARARLCPTNSAGSTGCRSFRPELDCESTRNHHKGGENMSTYTEHRVGTAVRARGNTIRTLLELGGFIAGAVLVAFGVVAIFMGFSGRSTVSDSLKQEKI